MVADHAPASMRGTAFGLFHLAIGLAALAASVLAGLLWTVAGPQWTFLAGGAFAALALLGALPLHAANGAGGRTRG
jgi:MFS family permease